MKFIRKHKGLVIVLIIIVILLIVGFIFAKNFFFSDEESAIYGTRLNGIEKVKITDKKTKEIEDALKEGTTKVNVRLSGRIIYISIQVPEGTTTEAARGIGNKSLDFFSEDEKAYYDIQVLIGCDAENTQFPILGYKHHTKAAINWTRDRS